MESQAPRQPEMEFDASSTANGYETWQQQRRTALSQLARKLGLPLGHQVEVCLRGGIVLTGQLRLREECLFYDEAQVRPLDLAVGRVTFLPAEIEACVRLD